jgi:hypothetical protein
MEKNTSMQPSKRESAEGQVRGLVAPPLVAIRQRHPKPMGILIVVSF